MALDGAWPIARIHGVSDAGGHRRAGDPPFRRLVAGREQGVVAGAVSRDRSRHYGRHRRSVAWAQNARAVLGFAGAANRLDNLDPWTGRGTKVACPTARTLSGFHRLLELGRLPVASR